MRKYVFFLILGCTFYSCYQTFRSTALESSFSELQLQDIDRIICYMDSMVLDHHPTLDKSTAYHTFFDSVRINFLEINEPLFNEIAMDETTKYNFLKSLDTSTFHAIWVNEVPLMIRTKDTIIEKPVNFHSLEINNQGQVMHYLKLLGGKSDFFKSVHESIQGCGAICPTLFAGMFYNHKKLNFNKIDDRFWAAIFYLTIEESTEKKIERYY